MRIGVLGTGAVGQALGGTLADSGAEVMLGTRDPAALAQRPEFTRWHEKHPTVTYGSFAEAAAHGEMVVNATKGEISLEVLGAAGEERLAGKVLVDVANPLAFSDGTLSLSVCNTDSLAEQIQRTFPAARVVKTLNTTNASVMVNPGGVAGGEHHMFVAGDDPEAKAVVTGVLRELLGWKHVLDVGDLSAARGLEMLLPLWLRVMQAVGTPTFNFRVVT